jgi:hypothetical protein
MNEKLYILEKEKEEIVVHLSPSGSLWQYVRSGSATKSSSFYGRVFLYSLKKKIVDELDQLVGIYRRREWRLTDKSVSSLNSDADKQCRHWKCRYVRSDTHEPFFFLNCCWWQLIESKVPIIWWAGFLEPDTGATILLCYLSTATSMSSHPIDRYMSIYFLAPKQSVSSKYMCTQWHILCM